MSDWQLDVAASILATVEICLDDSAQAYLLADKIRANLHATFIYFANRLYPAVDAADKESCRPDFAVPIYPGHLWIDHKHFVLSPDIHVTW